MTRPGTADRAAAGGRAPRRARSGRRAGDSGTREAILYAARQQFADHGYGGATIRSIAADAAVDPALVHHFYGNKERLFAAAMRMPIVPSEIITAALAPGARDPGISIGEHLVRTALGVWEDAALQETFLGLLRSAVTSEKAAAMLREFVAATIMGPISQAVSGAEAGEGGAVAEGRVAAGGGAVAEGRVAAGGGRGTADPEAEYRAAMVAAQMLGLAVARYVLALPPVVSASRDDLVAAIGPTVDRYLTGQIRSAREER